MEHSKIEKIINKFESWFLGFWIKQYRVSFLLIGLMIILGLASFMAIPKKSSPDLELGIISITKPYIWVNPEDIDSLITDKIEKKIKDITGIKKIDSTSSLGFSSVVLELENGIDVQDKMTEVKDEIDKINFPSEAEDTIVQDITATDNTLFSMVFYAPEDTYGKDYLLEKAIELKLELEGTKGINKIDVSGSEDYEIRVLVDKGKLDALWLTINRIADTIRQHNQNTPIGNYAIGDLNYDFRFDGELKELKEFLNIPVLSRWNSIVYLKDISNIKRHFKNEAISKVSFPEGNGYNSLILSVKKSDGEDFFSSSQVAKEVLEKTIAGFKYEGISYEIFLDASAEMEQSYIDLFRNMMTTFGLVFITLLIFIWFKEGFIGVLIVPLSYLITFIVLYYAGFSLNFLTNFSLILSLWVAIDTIIVVIEWANKKVQLGYHPKHAILIAIREYAPPIISGTMTTLAAFIPMLALPGIMGKYLSYIPITVFITLLASLFLSLTVTSAIFMKLTKDKPTYRTNKKEEETISWDGKILLDYDRRNKSEKTGERSSKREKIFDGIADVYFNLLKKFISTSKSRLLLICVPIFLLLASFQFGHGFELFPQSDNRQINVTIETKEGRNTESMAQYIDALEANLDGIPEVWIYNVTVENNQMNVVVELLEKSERDALWMRNSFEVEKEMNERLDIFRTQWLRVESWVLAGGPPGWKAVGIKLIASDVQYLSTLKQVSDDFEEFLSSIPGTKNVWSSSSATPGQFVFKLNYPKIASLWLTPSEITGAIFASTNGFTAGTIKGELDDYDIKVQIEQFENNLSPYQIENLVLNTSVWDIKLVDIASYSFDTAISQITRVDTKITTTVDSDLEEGLVASAIQPQLIAFAETYNFPIGTSFEAAGEAEENSELIVSTLIAFGVALFLIFIILVLQFNSYAQPAVILYSVVLALLWVNAGLFILWIPYSMAFAIWFIALTWIVINNAIIYIDRINTNLREWLSNTEAILYAGKSRLVPMLVTTVTTVCGILPIAFQDEFWAWLGFTIVFGLMTGTVMTLFVIPSLFYQTFMVRRGALHLLLGFVGTILLYIPFSMILWAIMG